MLFNTQKLLSDSTVSKLWVSQDVRHKKLDSLDLFFRIFFTRLDAPSLFFKIGHLNSRIEFLQGSFEFDKVFVVSFANDAGW